MDKSQIVSNCGVNANISAETSIKLDNGKYGKSHKAQENSSFLRSILYI